MCVYIYDRDNRGGGGECGVEHLREKSVHSPEDVLELSLVHIRKELVLLRKQAIVQDLGANQTISICLYSVNRVCAQGALCSY